MSIQTGNKIKKIREFKNYTQEYMGDKLGMSQNNYSKLETGQTKIDTDRLKKISEVLEVPVETILDDSQNITFNNSNNYNFFAGYVLNLQEENKELMENNVRFLQDQIVSKQKEIDRLLTLLEGKMK